MASSSAAYGTCQPCLMREERRAGQSRHVQQNRQRNIRHECTHGVDLYPPSRTLKARIVPRYATSARSRSFPRRKCVLGESGLGTERSKCFNRCYVMPPHGLSLRWRRSIYLGLAKPSVLMDGQLQLSHGGALPGKVGPDASCFPDRSGTAAIQSLAELRALPRRIAATNWRFRLDAR